MGRPRNSLEKSLALVAKDLIEANQSIADIGVIIGVLGEDSLKWLQDLKKECTTIDEFIEMARQRADISLIAAAVKAAMGYDYEEVDDSFIKIPDGYDDIGRPKMRDMRSGKKVKTKRALPNEALLRFLLKCRLPEYFQDTQRIEINKKTIEIKEITQKEIEGFGRKLLESIKDENKNS